MSDWLRDLKAGLGCAPAALVTVLATEGSAPRGAGTRMLVRADGLSGTIGGGALEHQATEQARAILALPPGSWRVQDWPLGPLLGQCCGGRVRLLIEHVDPALCGWLEETHERPYLVTRLEEGHVVREMTEKQTPTRLSARGERPGAGARFVELLKERARPLYLFGAGHVGQAVARHADGLPLQLCWFDTRPEMADWPGVTLVDEEGLMQCVAGAPAESAMAILTHSHALDYALTLEALRRPPLAYVGLIGSKTKRARFLRRLEEDGVDAAGRARLTCPIGLPGIVGKAPDVIALALLAQLLTMDSGEGR